MKAIRVKYSGATNTRGARLHASDCDGNRISIPYPYELGTDDAHAKAAQALCDKMHWGGKRVMGWLGPVSVHVFAGDGQ